MTTNTEALFERRTMLDNLDQDVELMRLLAQTFVDDAPRLLAELHATLNRGDTQAAAQASHAIKGSAANFGAARLVEVVQALERSCRNDDLDTAVATAGDTEALVNALVAELVAELFQELPSS